MKVKRDSTDLTKNKGASLKSKPLKATKPKFKSHLKNIGPNGFRKNKIVLGSGLLHNKKHINIKSEIGLFAKPRGEKMKIVSSTVPHKKSDVYGVVKHSKGSKTIEDFSAAIPKHQLKSFKNKLKPTKKSNNHDLNDIKSQSRLSPRPITEKEIPAVNTQVKTNRRKKEINPSNEKLTENVSNRQELSPLRVEKVTQAVAALMKAVKPKTEVKGDLLDLAEPILLQVECIKIPICPPKMLRFKLPHPLVNELSDILLITADKKGAKIYPEKAVEYYTELLAKHNINFIQKVMPMRTLRQEYSQYEMRRKLVDQFDVILADANIIKSLPGKLGKFVMFKHKMPIAVHLDHKHLKGHLQNAISKTQMPIKSNSHYNVAQVGHTKMSESQVAENIVEVSRGLAQQYPGGWLNVRLMAIKTNSSPALPVFFSHVSPNAVRIPLEVVRKRRPVEGELSTMPGMNAIVKGDGTVLLKRVEELAQVDDSLDDEILREAEKYMKSSRTVRQGDSDDDASDKESEALTAAVEKKMLKSYQQAKDNAKGDDDNEEDEEEEEEENSDEEEPVLPTLTGKKRKKELSVKQEGKKSVNKKQKTAQNVKTVSVPKQKKFGEEAKPSPNNKKSPLKRGTRGGKKKKLNKDQRKAMIKRKKAGKK